MAIGDKWQVKDPKQLETLVDLHRQARQAVAAMASAVQRVDAADARYRAALYEVLPDLPKGRRLALEVVKGVLIVRDVGADTEEG